MKKDDKNLILRQIPSVDHLLESSVVKKFLLTAPRVLVVKAIRSVLDTLREKLVRAHAADDLPDLALDSVVDQIKKQILVLSQPSLRQVINATGSLYTPIWEDHSLQQMLSRHSMP